MKRLKSKRAPAVATVAFAATTTAFLIGTLWATAPGAAAQQSASGLTAEEEVAGWQILFGGDDLDAWRGFRRDEPPAGWSVEDGVLSFTPGQGGGDLLTRQSFADFELTLEWKVAEGGNSGIFFRVSEDWDRTWETGPEMQVLDNAGHRDGRDPRTSAGSNYALHAPLEDVTRSVGEWNRVRLVVNGSHVEHWLNGVKLLEYELWSDDWEARVRASKFDEMPGYGRNRAGHIALQDHGDPVWYRDVKIRLLDQDP